MMVDLADHARLVQMAQGTVDQSGRLDILVYDAGVLSAVPLSELAEEEWDRVIAVNLKAVFLCSKHAARVMVKQESGRIINIFSTSGQIGAPGQGSTFSVTRSGRIASGRVATGILEPVRRRRVRRDSARRWETS